MRSLPKYGLLVIASTIAVSCSLEPKSNESRLFLSFLPGSGEEGRARDNPIDLISSMASSPTYPLKAAPSTASGFPCFAVNVVGPGIADSSANPSPNFDLAPLMNETNYCSYRGVVAGPIYNSTTAVDIALSVPAGANRLVQIVGIDTAAECATAIAPDDSNSTAKIYEVGRWKGDLFSDRSITVAKSYPEAGTSSDREARVLNCDHAGSCANPIGGVVNTAEFIMTAPTYTVSQKIPTVVGKYLSRVDLYLFNPSTSVTIAVTLVTALDNAGAPSGTAFATSSLVNIPPQTGGWYQFDFGTPGNYPQFANNSIWLQPTSSSPFQWKVGASGGAGSTHMYRSGGGTYTTEAQDIGSVTALAASPTGTCARNSSGIVNCWGGGGLGQMGNQTIVDFHAPTPVYSASGSLLFSSVSGGNGEHFCGITTSNGLYCWGNGVNGQLGQNSAVSASQPQQVLPASFAWTKAVTGTSHTCGLDGSALYCWGRNDNCQVDPAGVCSPTQYLQTKAVTGMTAGVTHIALGENHTCVLQVGDLKCWGANTFGQGGSGNFSSPLSTPNILTTSAFGGQAIAEVTAGLNYTCARTVPGRVYCWGENYFAELGSGAVGTSMSTPQAVPYFDHSTAARTATALYSGPHHTCASVASGGFYCWGANGSGQLGRGTSTASELVPAPAVGVNSVTRAALGNAHTCVQVSSGEVACFGQGTNGALGFGLTTADYSSPVPVLQTRGFSYKLYDCVN